MTTCGASTRSPFDLDGAWPDEARVPADEA